MSTDRTARKAVTGKAYAAHGAEVGDRSVEGARHSGSHPIERRDEGSTEQRRGAVDDEATSEALPELPFTD